MLRDCFRVFPARASIRSTKIEAAVWRDRVTLWGFCTIA